MQYLVRVFHKYNSNRNFSQKYQKCRVIILCYKLISKIAGINRNLWSIYLLFKKWKFEFSVLSLCYLSLTAMHFYFTLFTLFIYLYVYRLIKNSDQFTLKNSIAASNLAKLAVYTL